MVGRLNYLRWAAFLGLLLGVLTPSSHAVIIKGEPGRNTSPPAGDLAGSGWGFQGRWRGFVGTPISPHHFITASHVGGSIGSAFTYQGSEHRTTAFWDNPDSDLRVWRVDSRFSSYSPLYDASGEVGQTMIVFGRGVARGASVEAAGQLKGWLWGDNDRMLSWGQNTVECIIDGGDRVGELLSFTFDASEGPNESHLSSGDSGGGVFILDDGVWKLAGVNRSASGPYRLTDSQASFNAALLDQSGLYQQFTGGVWMLMPDRVANVPGTSYATRISSNIDWIRSTIPEPSTGLLFFGLWISVHRYRRRQL